MGQQTQLLNSPSGKFSLDINKPIDSQIVQSYLDFTLEQGMTKTLFQDVLYIGLIAISYSENPLRYKIWFNVSEKNKEPMSLEKLDVGAVTYYQNYEIRILSAGITWVKFRVSRLDKGPNPNQRLTRPPNKAPAAGQPSVE